MDLRDLTRTFMRLWYLTLPLLLLAGVIGAGVWSKVGSTYTSTASLVLIPPTSVVDANRSAGTAYSANNPLLYLGGMTEARDVVVSSISTPSLAEEMLKSYHATATVSGQPGSTAPIVVIQIESTSPSDSLKGLEHLVSEVPNRLMALQEDMQIAGKDKVSAMTLAVDGAPTVERKRQLEFSVAAFAFIMMSGALAIAMFDARRRSTGDALPPRSQSSKTTRRSEGAASAGRRSARHGRNPKASSSQEAAPGELATGDSGNVDDAGHGDGPSAGAPSNAVVAGGARAR